MKDALEGIYGRWQSPASRVLGPIVDWRTYLRFLRLGLMFPLGVAYFVFLLLTFTVGLALIWTILGPLILVPTLFLTRWAGDLEAWSARRQANIELHRPPTAIDFAGSPRTEVWTRLIDPSTWTGLVYLVLQFPIGVAALLLLVFGAGVSGALVAAPAIVELGGDPVRLGSTSIGSWLEALPLVPVGVLVFVLLVHAVNLFSAAHAAWARKMLGTRARNIPAGAPPQPPPGRPGGSPTPLPTPLPTALPPADSALALLTPREREVLGLIAHGYSNAEIGEALVISEGTVKTHVKRLLSKLELRDRTQASVYAYESGFIEPQASSTPPYAQRRRARP